MSLEKCLGNSIKLLEHSLVGMGEDENKIDQLRDTYKKEYPETWGFKYFTHLKETMKKYYTGK